MLVRGYCESEVATVGVTHPFKEKAMRPVSDKASKDAWIMLACAIADTPFNNRNVGRTMASLTDKNLHQNICGEGFRPQEIACMTEHGKLLLGLQRKTMLGCTPTEFRYRRSDQ